VISQEPGAERFLKRYGGTQELVNGGERWCVWVDDKDVDEARSFVSINRLIESCAQYRATAGRDARKAAAHPHAFCYTTFKDEVGVQVGLTIGNGLAFVPARLRPAGFVSSHTAYMLYGWRPVEFSVIVSALMRTWAEAVGGKLGNGMRFSNTLVYNTFPVPSLTQKNKEDLTRCAEEIVLAREAHFPATIADLYDPEKMPDDLRAAHDRNDEVLERIYIGRRFKNDTERLEKLFELYTKMTQTKGAA
jgi:hypothetical protein